MGHTTFTLDQDGFRFYEDDAAINSGPTAIAALNTDITRGTTGTNRVRLRLLLQETTGGSSNNVSHILQYSHNGGTWTQVTTGSSFAAFVGSTYAEGTLTSGVLGGTGTFVDGEMTDDGAPAPSISYGANEHTELEFCVFIRDADVSANDTIDFRVLEDGAVLSGNYDQVPRWTVAAGTTTGTASSVTPSITQSASGTHTPAPVTGTAAQTTPSVTQAASGTVPIPENISTINQTTGDYSTIQAWATAMDTSTTGQVWIGEITDAVDYDETVLFNSSEVSTSGEYAWLRAGSSVRHDGDQANYGSANNCARIVNSGAGHAIELAADTGQHYFRLSDLVVINTTSNASDECLRIGSDVLGVLVERCVLIPDVDTGQTDGIYINDVSANGETMSLTVHASLIMGANRSGIHLQGDNQNADGNYYLNLSHNTIEAYGANSGEDAGVQVRTSLGSPPNLVAHCRFYNTYAGSETVGSQSWQYRHENSGSPYDENLDLDVSHCAEDSTNLTTAVNTTSNTDGGFGWTDSPSTLQQSVNKATAFEDLGGDTTQAAYLAADARPLSTGALYQNGTNSSNYPSVTEGFDSRCDYTTDIAHNAYAATPTIGAYEHQTVAITGTAASVTPSITQAASGSLNNTGTAASVVAAITQAASGSLNVTGTAASVTPSITQAASGSLNVTGTADSVVPAVTQAASGVLTSSGSAASTVPSVTQDASGSYTAAQFSGIAASVVAAVTQVAAGVLIYSGAAAATTPSITQSAAGTNTPPAVTGTAASTVPSITQSASGTLNNTGTATSTFASITQSASGTSAEPDAYGSAGSKLVVTGTPTVTGENFAGGSYYNIIGMGAKALGPEDNNFTFTWPSGIAEGDLAILIQAHDNNRNYNGTGHRPYMGTVAKDSPSGSPYNCAIFQGIVDGNNIAASTSVDYNISTSEQQSAFGFVLPEGWKVDDASWGTGTTSAEGANLPGNVTTDNDNGILIAVLARDGGETSTTGSYDFDANTGWEYLASVGRNNTTVTSNVALDIFLKKAPTSGTQTVGQPWTYTGSYNRQGFVIALSPHATQALPQVVGAETSSSSSDSETTPTINYPANLAVGDLMLLSYSHSTGRSDSVSITGGLTGWTAIQTNIDNQLSPQSSERSWLYWRIADSGDVSASPASFDLTVSGGGKFVAHIVAIRNHDASTPIGAVGTVTTDGLSTWNFPTVTTNNNNSLGVAFMAGASNRRNGDWNDEQPARLLEIWEQSSGAGSAVTSWLNILEQPTAGLIDTGQYTDGSVGTDLTGVAFEVRVAAVSFTGTAAQTIPSVTQAASGSLNVTGTAAQTLAAVTQAASGTSGLPITGTAASVIPSVAQAAVSSLSTYPLTAQGTSGTGSVNTSGGTFGRDVLAATVANTRVAATTFVVDKPGGVLEDELLIFAAVSDASETFTNSGWTGTTPITTFANTSGSFNVAWKRATASDQSATDYDLGTGTSESMSGAIIRLPSNWAIDDSDPGFAVTVTESQTERVPGDLVVSNANGLLISYLFWERGQRHSNTGGANLYPEANTAAGWKFLGWAEWEDGNSISTTAISVFIKELTNTAGETVTPGQPWLYSGTGTRGTATFAASEFLPKTGTAASVTPSVTQSASGDVVASSFSGDAASVIPSITQAATGSLKYFGPVFSNISAVTQSAAGTFTPSYFGDAAQTTPAVTQSAAGVLRYSGTGASTTPATTQAATGAQKYTGTAASVTPALTSTGQAQLGAEGAASSSIGAVTQAATGEALPARTGTIEQTLAAVTQQAGGFYGTPSFTGAGDSIVPSVTQSASGGLSYSGAAASVVPSVTQAAIGHLSYAGGAAQTTPAVTQAATGELIFSGAAAQTLAAVTQDAAGTYTPAAFTGTAESITPSVTQSATGTQRYTGTAASVTPSVTQIALGAGVGISGTAESVVPSVTQQATGSLIFAGTAASTIPATTQAASGTLRYTGAATGTVGAVTQQATGTVVQVGFAGNAASVIPSVTQSAAGTSEQLFQGAAASVVGAVTQAAVGERSVFGPAASVIPSLTQAAVGQLGSQGTAASTTPSVEQAASGVSAETVGTAASLLPSLTQAAAGFSDFNYGRSVIPALTQDGIGLVDNSGVRQTVLLAGAERAGPRQLGRLLPRNLTRGGRTGPPKSDRR